MEQVTHAQIAKVAGLSRSTVSRALQNHPAIPGETRRRVQALAEKMGYRPNPLVSALMATRNRPAASAAAAAISIATLTAWAPTRELAPTPSTRRLLRGAADRAAALGYCLEEFWIDEPGMTGQRLSQILLNRGIVAVLLAPLADSHAPLELAWEHFSVATFAPSAPFPGFHRASHFHFSGACLALEEVARRGYRRPGMVLCAAGVQHVREQYLGGLAAVEKRGTFPGRIPSLVLRNDGPGELRAWLRRHEPDIIVGDEPRTLPWLRELGHDVPLAPAFAHLDRPPGDEFGGIDQLKELIGRSVIDLLVAQLHRNERGVPDYAKDIKLPGVWRDGASVPGRG
ncbi:MAG: LacI family DNA-binding transcriptional regulator [Verrucomicrobiota bacterium]